VHYAATPRWLIDDRDPQLGKNVAYVLWASCKILAEAMERYVAVCRARQPEATHLIFAGMLPQFHTEVVMDDEDSGEARLAVYASVTWRMRLAGPELSTEDRRQAYELAARQYTPVVYER